MKQLTLDLDQLDGQLDLQFTESTEDPDLLARAGLAAYDDRPARQRPLMKGQA